MNYIVTSKYIEQFTLPSEIHESLFVGNLWKNPNNYSKYKTHKIVRETFTQDIWYFYYYIGKEMFDNGVRSFEDTTVYSYVSSKPKEGNKKSYFELYNEYGGFSTIQELMSECSNNKGNDEFHFSEIQKYESLRQMQDNNMINVLNMEHVLKLINMTLKELQTFCSVKVKDVFSHINSGDVVEYNLTEDIEEVVDELDEGEEVGLPLFDSPRLTKKINGQKLGNLMYLVLSSGVGKSSIVTEKFVLSCFEHNVKVLKDETGEMKFEKALIFVNEEGKKRWQSRLLATVASRILKKPIPRDVVNRGKYTPEVKEILKEAARWLKQNQPDFIKLIVLKKYRIEDVINRIEQYRARGYDKIYFDTFKPDQSQNVERWLAFSNSAQDLYDCIKEENYNCSTLATVQMKIGKEFRYIDLDSIGKSMEIVEVAAIVMAGRLMFADEYPNCKYELKPYNWEKSGFDGKWHKKEYVLDPEKKYLILFLPKNREGSEDEQIIYEVISDLNVWKEVAFVQVPNNGSNYNK
ncbi:replication protein [Paenibacillus sp. N1-5-1-14]|uniref:replication protein n=1 Tax=Paenibacillus radicibacter TaxID=2972488 RepID=UPI002158DFFD|nr:replication protein [Paenibacillus radicibacter]MCR8641415.1 replication protein [Paenibacillus radicibacter]